MQYATLPIGDNGESASVPTSSTSISCLVFLFILAVATGFAVGTLINAPMFSKHRTMRTDHIQTNPRVSPSASTSVTSPSLTASKSPSESPSSSAVSRSPSHTIVPSSSPSPTIPICQWHQLSGKCNLEPFQKYVTRHFWKDLECTDKIPVDARGYCYCGDNTRRFVDCGHPSDLTCHAECSKKDFLDPHCAKPRNTVDILVVAGGDNSVQYEFIPLAKSLVLTTSVNLRFNIITGQSPTTLFLFHFNT